MNSLHWSVAAIGLATASLSTTCSAELTYSQTKNVVYGESHGVGLIMDIFEPTGAKNGRAIIDVVSGGWSSSRAKIRDHKLAGLYDIFCGRGYVVFAIRPGSISKFTGHEMLDHLWQGVAWVKQHAGDYGIAPDRLGMIGASAGGHLASLAAVKASGKSQGVACVGVFFPPTDLVAFAGKDAGLDGTSEVSKLLRALAVDSRNEAAPNASLPARLTDLSPALLVSGDEPPFLLIHGDADPVVPLEQSQKLYAALTSKGVSAKLIVKPGGGHPWLTIRKEVAVMADWMDSQMTTSP